MDLSTSEVVFHRGAQEPQTQTLVIANTDKSRTLAYKVKTTKPLLFTVRPNASTISPGERLEVQITRNSSEGNNDTETSKEKFLILGSLIDDRLTENPIHELWQELEKSKNYESARVRVVYDTDGSAAAGTGSGSTAYGAGIGAAGGAGASYAADKKHGDLYGSGYSNSANTTLDANTTAPNGEGIPHGTETGTPSNYDTKTGATGTASGPGVAGTVTQGLSNATAAAAGGAAAVGVAAGAGVAALGSKLGLGGASDKSATGTTSSAPGYGAGSTSGPGSTGVSGTGYDAGTSSTGPSSTGVSGSTAPYNTGSTSGTAGSSSKYGDIANRSATGAVDNVKDFNDPRAAATGAGIGAAGGAAAGINAHYGSKSGNTATGGKTEAGYSHTGGKTESGSSNIGGKTEPGYTGSGSKGVAGTGLGSSSHTGGKTEPGSFSKSSSTSDYSHTGGKTAPGVGATSGAAFADPTVQRSLEEKGAVGGATGPFSSSSSAKSGSAPSGIASTLHSRSAEIGQGVPVPTVFIIAFIAFLIGWKFF